MPAVDMICDKPQRDTCQNRRDQHHGNSFPSDLCFIEAKHVSAARLTITGAYVDNQKEKWVSSNFVFGISMGRFEYRETAG